MNNSWAQSNRRVTDLHTGIWSECARVRGSDDESARARARSCICSSLEMRVDAVIDLSIWENVKKRVDEEKRRGFMMEGINDPRRRRRRNSFRLWGAFPSDLKHDERMSDENNTTLRRTLLSSRYTRFTDAHIFINIRGSGASFTIYSEKWAFVMILNHNRPSHVNINDDEWIHHESFGFE